MRLLAMLAVAAWMAPGPLQAQDATGRTTPQRRVALFLEIGPTFGGPGSGLLGQLRGLGFDDTRPGGCFLIGCVSATAHPTRQKPGTAVYLGARLRLRRTVAVGLGYGNTALGGAIGYRADTAIGIGDYVISNWDVTLGWAGIFWQPHPIVHLGGGPAVYRLESVTAGESLWRFGVTGEVGLAVPVRRRFFLSVAARGHLIPAADVPHGPQQVVLRPAWSHASLLVGVGVRL